ncbi:MAG TPA: flagellar protein FlaG [Rectinemataceae bacterium]|nr:flagellar protein FlaG [Rectinemataceae bacterium]
MSIEFPSIQSSPPAALEALHHGASATGTPIYAGAQSTESGSIPPAQLQSMIHDMQKVSEAFNRRLSFSINEKLGQVVVKVIDSDTDKVVREIPPVELQRVYERIREVIGLLFDKKA